MCIDFSLAGLVLGGGIGHSGRELGMLIDSLKSLEMVDYKGDVIKASNDENADLFWASRGGGGGQFGVLTSLEFQAYPRKDRIFHYKITWNKKDFIAVMKWWQFAAATAPYCISSALHFEKGEHMIMYGYSSESKSHFFEWLENALFYEKVPKPISNKFMTITYMKSVLLAGGDAYGKKGPKALLNDESEKPLAFKVLSAYGYKLLNDLSLEKFYSNLDDMPKSCKNSLLIKALGGKYAEVEPSATAYPHRKALFLLHLGIWWERSTNVNWLQKCLDWQQRTVDAMAGDLEGAYQNYADANLANYMQDYYGPNVDRLIEVKTKYDPYNMFRYEQSIPVK